MQPSPTVASIAKVAGVCKSTVSLALRNSPKVREPGRQRIQEIAAKMGYRPNPLVTAQMAHIRSKTKRRRPTTVGFLSTWLEETGHKRPRWSVIGRYYQGALAQAEKIGISLELLEFDRARFSDRRIQEILRARNLDGLVLAPLRYSDTKLELDWSQLALAAIGYYRAFGNIHRVFFDNFHCIQTLFGELQQRGYRRIGFITNQETEARTGHMWSGGYLDYQSRNVPAAHRVPLLRLERQETQFTAAEYRLIRRWYTGQRPDVIIGFLDTTLRYLESAGYKVNEDFGYVALSWTEDLGDCAGYYQSLQEVGAAALDAVAERLYRNERGMPYYPTTTLLSGKFVEGKTLRAVPTRPEDSRAAPRASP